MSPSWTRSSYCIGDSHCVEIAFVGDAVLMRNSTRPELVLELTPAEWDAFLWTVRGGAGH